MATRSGGRRSNRNQSFSPAGNSGKGPLCDEDNVKLLKLENEMLKALRKCHKSWETLERYHAFFLKELLNVKSDVQGPRQDVSRIDNVEILAPTSSTMIALHSDRDSADVAGMERLANRIGNKNSPTDVYVVTIDQRSDDALFLSSTGRPRRAATVQNYSSANRRRRSAKKKTISSAGSINTNAAAQRIQPCSVVLERLSVPQVEDMRHTTARVATEESSIESSVSLEIPLQSSQARSVSEGQRLRKRQHIEHSDEIIQETPQRKKKPKQQASNQQASHLNVGLLSNKELFTTEVSDDSKEATPSAVIPPTRKSRRTTRSQDHSSDDDKAVRETKSSSLDFVNSPSIISITSSSYSASEASDNALRKSVRLFESSKRATRRSIIMPPPCDTDSTAKGVSNRESNSDRDQPTNKKFRKSNSTGAKGKMSLRKRLPENSRRDRSTSTTPVKKKSKKERSSSDEYQCSEATSDSSYATCSSTTPPPRVSPRINTAVSGSIRRSVENNTNVHGSHNRNSLSQTPPSPPQTRSKRVACRSSDRTSPEQTHSPSKGIDAVTLSSRQLRSKHFSSTSTNHSTPLSPAHKVTSSNTRSQNQEHSKSISSTKSVSSNMTLRSTCLGDTTLNNTTLLRKRRKILLNSRPPINDLSLDEDTTKNATHASVKIDARSFIAPKNKLSRRDKLV